MSPNLADAGRSLRECVFLERNPCLAGLFLRNSSVEARGRLRVNEAKSKVVPLAEASFLGFRILRKKIRWTDRSREKLKARVRAITKRTRGVSPGQVMADPQRYLRGAVNYYACGIPYREIIELDQWLRRRVRLYHWKQWGRPRTRRRKLLALGIDRGEVHMASRSRKGHWRMSRNPAAAGCIAR